MNEPLIGLQLPSSHGAGFLSPWPHRTYEILVELSDTPRPGPDLTLTLNQ